jgi:signal transduction histidine kinase
MNQTAAEDRLQLQNERMNALVTELAGLNEQLSHRVQERTASLRASEAKETQTAQALARSERELRALAARLEGVREKERTELAREIHDVLGQDLTGLKIDVAWTIRRLAKPSEPEIAAARERLASLRVRIDEIIAIVRRVATGLRPGVLDDLGLGAALEWQAREFENRTGVACEMWVAGSDDRVGKDLATSVFRIYQELLTNVARHAGAKHVRSRLCIEHDVLLLEVVDDGCGLSESDVLDDGSLGLVGIRERVLAFGGAFLIKGSPENGTRALVRVPILGEQS